MTRPGRELMLLFTLALALEVWVWGFEPLLCLSTCSRVGVPFVGGFWGPCWPCDEPMSRVAGGMAALCCCCCCLFFFPKRNDMAAVDWRRREDQKRQPGPQFSIRRAHAVWLEQGDGLVCGK